MKRHLRRFDWLKNYRDVAKLGVHFTAVAKEMMRRYPDHGFPILLWLTHGPASALRERRACPPNY